MENIPARGCLGAIIGTALALVILALAHYGHIWTLLGFPYN